jgi:hypothetical protein
MLESLERYCTYWIMQNMDSFNPIEIAQVGLTLNNEILVKYCSYVGGRREEGGGREEEREEGGGREERKKVPTGSCTTWMLQPNWDHSSETDP